MSPRGPTAFAAGAINAIQCPMKSPGDSGDAFFREGTDAAALRVPEHDDVFHLERLHGEFERGRHGALRAVRRVGRDQVADVAHDEQFARPRVEDHLGRARANCSNRSP